MNMTIDDVKKKRIELEKMISDELKSFEKDTSTRIGYISIQRAEPKQEKSNSPETVMSGFEYDDRDIVTVDFELRFTK